MREQLLVCRAQEGDKGALETLLVLYEKKIYNYCFRTCGNKEDALDLSQDTFMRVCSSIKGFRGDASFAAWIYRIANNACIDYIRRRAKCRFISIDVPVEGEDGDLSWQVCDRGPGPQELAEYAALKQGVTSGIGTLSAEHKSVIIMHDLQNLTYGEIAVAVECPLGTVKSRLSRARTALKRHLLANGLIGQEKLPEETSLVHSYNNHIASAAERT